MGSYQFADTIFPFGGRRGEPMAVTFFGGKLRDREEQSGSEAVRGDRGIQTLASAGLAAMPFLFAVSDYARGDRAARAAAGAGESTAGSMKEGEVDRYRVAGPARRAVAHRNAGARAGYVADRSDLTAFDAAGKKLDSAGDKPLPEDVFAVQGSSRTSSDPFLNLTVPKDVREITLAIEDLALRGGPLYGYRLVVAQAAEDFRLTCFSVCEHSRWRNGASLWQPIGADMTVPFNFHSGSAEGRAVEGGMIPRETSTPTTRGR